MTITLGNPSFWTLVNRSLGTVQHDRNLSLRYVVLDFRAEMRVILRTREELFTTTVNREGARARVVVNGNYYDVGFWGQLDAAIGSDPVDPSHTIVEGRLISRGAIIGGSSEPQMFYFAQMRTPAGRYSYTSAFGDPPAGAGLGNSTVQAAIGGAGPLIVGGLNYGVRNAYRPGVPPGAPARGQPPPAAAPYLVQRSNDTFRSMQREPRGTGKTILAAATGQQRIMVAIQPHGAPSGTLHDFLRDRLAARGFDHAVFLDGSDSSMMMVNGHWVEQPGSNKDETNVVGVAFF